MTSTFVDEDGHAPYVDSDDELPATSPSASKLPKGWEERTDPQSL